MIAAGEVLLKRDCNPVRGGMSSRQIAGSPKHLRDAALSASSRSLTAASLFVKLLAMDAAKPQPEPLQTGQPRGRLTRRFVRLRQAVLDFPGSRTAIRWVAWPFARVWQWYWCGSPELITARATAVLTILTAIGLLLSLRAFKDATKSAQKAIEEQEKVTSTTLLVSLEERWNSEQMQRSRKKLASQLMDFLEKKNEAPTSLDDMDTEVVDFFENVGYLTEHGSLDPRMVWNFFVWELSAYYTALARESKLIQEEQKRDGHVAVYAEIGWLYNRFDEIDKETNNQSKTSSKLVKPTLDDLKKFLKREMTLGDDNSAPKEEARSKK